MKYQSARSITTKNLRPSSITKKDICDLHVKDERITVFVNTCDTHISECLHLSSKARLMLHTSIMQQHQIGRSTVLNYTSSTHILPAYIITQYVCAPPLI